MYAADIKITDNVLIHWSAYWLVFLLVGLRDARSKPTRHQIDNRKLSQEADTNYLIGPKVFIASKLEWIVQLFSVAIISVGLLTRRFDGVSACCTTSWSAC